MKHSFIGRKAIAIDLLAAGYSPAATARIIGAAHPTVSHWLRFDRAFREAVKEERDCRHGAARKAIKALIDMAENPLLSVPDRVLAAESLLKVRGGARTEIEKADDREVLSAYMFFRDLRERQEDVDAIDTHRQFDPTKPRP